MPCAVHSRAAPTPLIAPETTTNVAPVNGYALHRHRRARGHETVGACEGLERVKGGLYHRDAT